MCKAKIWNWIKFKFNFHSSFMLVMSTWSNVNLKNMHGSGKSCDLHRLKIFGKIPVTLSTWQTHERWKWKWYQKLRTTPLYRETTNIICILSLSNLFKIYFNLATKTRKLNERENVSETLWWWGMRPLFSLFSTAAVSYLPCCWYLVTRKFIIQRENVLEAIK